MTIINTKQKLREAAPVLLTILSLMFIFTAGYIIGNMMGAFEPVNPEHVYTLCLNAYNYTPNTDMNLWTDAMTTCHDTAYGVASHE